MFTKDDLTKTIVILWIIGSVAYIGWDTWRDYQIRGVQTAYQSGYSDATKQIIDQSQADQCKQPLTISLGSNKLQLIDVACLQQPQQQAQGAGAPASAAQPQAAAAKK